MLLPDNTSSPRTRDHCAAISRCVVKHPHLESLLQAGIALRACVLILEDAVRPQNCFQNPGPGSLNRQSAPTRQLSCCCTPALQAGHGAGQGWATDGAPRGAWRSSEPRLHSGRGGLVLAGISEIPIVYLRILRKRAFKTGLMKCSQRLCSGKRIRVVSVH